MELFKLLGTIAVNNSDANKALDETSQKGEKTQSKLSKAFSKIGKGAAVVGKAVGTGMVVAGAAMGTLTVKALNLGGELEQNMGGSEQVFKKYAGQMQETAKNAFSNMGLSTSDFLATANKMGALFQGAGFDIKESADLSSAAMQRAADVASIMGLDTSAAMEAIAGAAKGNFTMMDNLGVAMNDTTLNAYALEKGINKTTQEMTNQEKIGLAMEMFMDKTAYAAGNYARENETLAGSLGTAKAALTNFLDGSGDVEQLVSSFSNLAKVIVNNLKELAPRLVSGLTDIVNQIMPMLPGLLQKLLPVIIQGAVSLINGLVAAMPTIISAIMSALPSLIQGVTQIINALIQALPQIMQALVSALPTLIPLIVDALVSMIVTLCTMLPEIIQPIIDYLPDIIIAIVDALLNNLPVLIKGLITLITGIVQALPRIFRSLVDSVVNIFKGIWEDIKNVFSNIGTWFKDKFNQGKENATNAWSDIKSKFTGIKDKITSAFSNIKEKLSQPFEKARDAIKGVVDKIKGFFSNMKLSLPKIKLPHFKITGKLSLSPPSIPKLSIDWYQKAMNNPMVLNDPTIFGYNPKTGSFMGGGEAGSEVVSGTGSLLRMIQGVVSGEIDAVAYYLQQLINMLADYFPQILELQAAGHVVSFDPDKAAKRLVRPMDRELGKLAKDKERGN